MANPQDAFWAELMQTFRAEMEEHLAALNAGLLALEGGLQGEARQEQLQALFRAAHSLKGAAGSVQLEHLAALAHRLEDALDFLRKHNPPLEAAHFDALFGMVDILRRAAENETPPEAQPVLERLEALLHPAEPAPAPPAEPAPAPPAEPTPAPPAEPATVSTHKPATPAEETIRVAVTRLDALMDGLGELLGARMRLDETLQRTHTLRQQVQRRQKAWRAVRPHYHDLARRVEAGQSGLPALLNYLKDHEQTLKKLESDLNALHKQLSSDRAQLNLITDSFENDIRRARMQPIAGLFDIFPRLVRDLGRQSGKQAALEIEGSETEVDRRVLEQLKDPLTHLVRNALGHGIEPPQERAALGKPPCGRICLRAEPRGSHLMITLSDDGRGIDLEAVRRQAVAQRMITPKEAETLDESQTLALIFRSGLSTAAQVSGIAGRGVGLDVVHRTLEQLGALLEVENHPGAGVTFRMTLPLSYVSRQVLLVRAAGETLAIPAANVARIQRIRRDQVGSVDGKPAVAAHGRLLPLYDLAQTLGLPASPASDDRLAIVHFGVVEKLAALRVEEFLATHEVVVKHLKPPLRSVRNVAGAAILGSGQVVIVLDPPGLMRSLEGAPPPALPAQPSAAQRQRSILVVDDSITTRTLEKLILENAGYAVTAVSDGSQAWELLRQPDAPLPDLIVSDINMPVMDGFALAEAVKSAARTAHIPLVLVTSLDSQSDRLRGLQAGADAYIVKTSFDQRELLEMIAQLIR